MDLRTLVSAALLVSGLAWSPAVAAQKLYVASVRTVAQSGSVGGSLYTVALATGSASFVAPIRLNGSAPLGITGLAVHPATGVFYGITSPLSPARGARDRPRGKRLHHAQGRRGDARYRGHRHRGREGRAHACRRAVR